ncbi:hypothetical protein ACIO1C_04320 [Streptomyces sp. NPDC087420]|uniref:hypothetical protein n=1 Tax=Streptomyces sp. NPDC087420 TaxID=3365785 RepID=UPI003835054D
MLLLIGMASAAAGILTAVLLLNNPPVPLSRFCAVLVLTFGASAVAVYCYGWLSVVLGGPFPELCEDRSPSGTKLTSLKQAYWPLRNACVYSDGSTVEYVSTSINTLVCVLAILAIALTGAATFLRRRPRQSPDRSPGEASL